jgi:hypothetical protein
VRLRRERRFRIPREQAGVQLDGKRRLTGVTRTGPAAASTSFGPAVAAMKLAMRCCSASCFSFHLRRLYQTMPQAAMTAPATASQKMPFMRKV